MALAILGLPSGATVNLPGSPTPEGATSARKEFERAGVPMLDFAGGLLCDARKGTDAGPARPEARNHRRGGNCLVPAAVTIAACLTGKVGPLEAPDLVVVSGCNVSLGTLRSDPGRLARYGLTTTFPVIAERWTMQKYGKLPAVGKVREKLPLDLIPESHFPSAMQHVPDVVEWATPLTHTHMTVIPARIVVVLLPL